nr:SMI1/KNR4 family protein [uncultured Carboxylicivirga sp.]
MRTTTVILIWVLFVIGCNFQSNNKKTDFSKNEQIIYMDSLEKRLNTISDNFKPIKQISLKYLKFGGSNEENNILIYNQKWIAPLKYGIRLFENTPDEFITKFEKDNNVKIPVIYKDFLREFNGCFIFDFDLFGLTPSIYTTGLLDRSKVQCFDLGTANRNWIAEYDIDEKLFHFGGRAYSYDENIGYFMDSTGIIKSIRTNGQIIKEWTDFSKFLSEEIEAAERMMIDELPKDEKEKL